MSAPKSPFDAVRGAFAELDASEKTAFVLEATFAAVGEGLAETGRRFSAAVQDIDDLFTPPHRAEPVTPNPAKVAPKKPAPRKKPAAKKPTAKKPAAKKPTAKKPPPSGGKTAGRASTPDDDA